MRNQNLEMENQTANTANSVLVYTESTPNPETLKFVTNQMLLPHHIAEFTDEKAAEESPLAKELFGFPFVNGVFITNNFVTVTKNPETQWHEVIPSLRTFFKEYLAEKKPVVSEAFIERKRAEQPAADGDEIEDKIRAILDKYVKPAVEMDGGAIIFKSFDDGVVTLQMQGACSGCPSSTVTLKAGIEGMLKRMIPEVTEVVAEQV